MKYPIHTHQRNFSQSLDKLKNLGQQEATIDRTLFYTFLNWLPNPDPILRKTGQTIQVYHDLTADDEVFSAIEMLNAGLQSLEPHWDEKDARPAELQAFREVFDEWDYVEFLSQVVNARLNGYQPFEIIWTKDGKYWLPEACIEKPAEWFFFTPEQEFRLRTRTNWINGEAVDPRKILVARNRPTYTNPYGEAVLSRVFWPVAFKKGGMKFWITLLEKFGMPWIVGKQPRGNDNTQTKDLLDSLSLMIQDAVAVIPDDSSVDIKQPYDRAKPDQAFESLVRYCDESIDKVILSNELTMTAQKSGGSYAATKAQLEVSQAVVRNVARMANQLIKKIINITWELNFTGPKPVFIFKEPKATNADIASRDVELNTQGVRFTKKYYVKTYGFAEDDFDIQEQTPAIPGMSHQHNHDPHFKDLTPEQQAAAEIEFAHDPQVQKESSNQGQIDQAIETGSGESAASKNQKMVETWLKPVMDMIINAESYEDIMTKLAGLFPEMNSNELQARMESAIFLADVMGRISETEEHEDNNS